MNIAQEVGGLRERSIEQLQNAIASEHDMDYKVSMERLEENIRDGEDKLYLGKIQASIDDTLKEVTTKIATEAFSALKMAIREQKDELNELHLVGGGAAMYLDGAKAVFPDMHITITDETVLANALGFWSYGAQS